MTANINVHAFTAWLVWPLCTATLVTSKNLHALSNPQALRQYNLCSCEPPEVVSFLYPSLYSFFFSHWGYSMSSTYFSCARPFLDCGSISQQCPVTESRIKGVQMIRKSEQWKVRDLFIFSWLCLVVAEKSQMRYENKWQGGVAFQSCWHSCLCANYLQVWQSITNLGGI